MILTSHPVTLLRKKIVAENTMELTFAISGSGLIFEAGQYISVCLPLLVDARVPDRCHDFSVASSPLNPNEISIAFRISESIFKSALLDVPIGAVVNIDGPKGVFTLPEQATITSTPISNVDGHLPNATRIVFVAGGIGITPTLSMIRYATETSSLQEMTLFYYNTNIEKTAYHEELSELQKNNKHFTYNDVLGIPNEKDFSQFIKNPEGTIWYIVGAPKMVLLVRQILTMSGILDSQIKFEEFPGY